MELWRAGSTDYDRYTIVHLHSLRHLRHAAADARSAHGAVCIHFHFSSFPSRNGTDVSEMSAARTLANWYAKGKWYAACNLLQLMARLGWEAGRSVAGILWPVCFPVAFPFSRSECSESIFLSISSCFGKRLCFQSRGKVKGF